jgi:glycosyltransferase involved in cell wall biosynthesis
MLDQPRVLIVSEHASAKFGGEAALPLHYFRVLRKRGLPVWLITHARTRNELRSLFPEEKRILYIEDTALHRLMWRVGQKLPAQIAHFTVGFISRFAAQLAQRKLVKRLVAEEKIDVIHQPMPVSPREPSMMFGFGVPVIIGPMNGGMDYPPAFKRHSGLIERWLFTVGRWSSSALNWLMPGKRRATLLLVANERTLRALPAGVCRRVIEIVENGVDLTIWNKVAQSDQPPVEDSLTTFVFVGRLIALKAVDLLLHAFQRAAVRSKIRLLIIGDGEERQSLEALATDLHILAEMRQQAGRVFFTGWLSQEVCAEEMRHVDCLVLPSLHECGGAVVLEAMSTGKAVIATAWGGPIDYIDESCGILVPPTDREAVIQGFADAMSRLASSAATRRQMGMSGRDKVIRLYDWEVKIDQILKLYERVRDSKAPVARFSDSGEERD